MRDLKDGHTQGAASSKEQGRKCLGIQLCQKEKPDNSRVCVQRRGHATETTSAFSPRELQMHPHKFYINNGYRSLLSIHAVLAGSDAHLAKASSSLIGGYSSLKTLEKHKQKCNCEYLT